MSRWVAAGLACAGALLVAGCAGSAPASAPAAGAAAPEAVAAPSGTAAARSAPFALVPDGPSNRVVVRAAAGERVRVPLRLANAADAERSFSLTAAGAGLDGPAEVRVPARVSVPVAAELRVPPDAPPGRVAAAVVATAGEMPGAAISVRYESSVRVTIHVVPAGRS